MKLLAFSVYDEKAEAFGNPFFMHAVGLATRLFGEWCNREDTPLGKHPEDYKLYHIGAWLDDCAKFDSVDQPIFVGNGTDFVEKPKLKEVK